MSCEACTFINPVKNKKCEICGTALPRPATEQPAEKAAEPSPAASLKPSITLSAAELPEIELPELLLHPCVGSAFATSVPHIVHPALDTVKRDHAAQIAGSDVFQVPNYPVLASISLTVPPPLYSPLSGPVYS